MKNLSKKLVMSIVAVTLVVAALGASTFAWFTLSNRASVGTFEAQVSSGEGIEIRLADTNAWFTDIPSSAIQTYLTNTAGFEKFKDITSANGKTFTKFNNSGYIQSTSDYVEFTLDIRSEQNLTVYWTDAVLTEEQAKTWTPDVNFTHTSGAVTTSSSLNLRVSNAARISVEGVVNEAPVLYVYEKGNVEGNTVLNETPIVNGSVSYYNAKVQVADRIPTSLTGITLKETFTSFNEDVNLNNAILSLVKAEGDTYATGSITVRVWIEGWDADTFNAILNETLRVSLAFEAE